MNWEHPVNPGEPIAGYFLHRWAENRIKVPIEIWHGWPRDPETWEEIERSPWDWHARGIKDRTWKWKLIFIWDVWPRCSGDPIEEWDAKFRIDNGLWYATHQPDSPHGDPWKPIDWLTV